MTRSDPLARLNKADSIHAEHLIMDTRRKDDGRFDHTGRFRPVMVERIGRQAVAAAVREHKKAGRDVYYTDAAFPGFVIREAPDGCRELLEEDAYGELQAVRTLGKDDRFS